MQKNNGSFLSVFFPAFVPLVGVIPWIVSFIISLVVIVAGFAWSEFIKKHKIAVTLLICSVVTIAVYVTGTHKAIMVIHKGTSIVNPNDFPEVKIYKSAEKYTPTKSDNFHVKWHVTKKNRILSNPILHGDTLIYGTVDGSLEAVSLKNGEAIWQLPKNEYVYSLSKDKQGNIYAGEGVHDTVVATLTSFNADTKKVNWQRKFNGHIESSPIIDEQRNKVWVTTGGGGLWAIDKTNADIKSHMPVGHIDSAPLIYKDRVYFQAQADENVKKATLYAINEESGEVIWTHEQYGNPWGSPKIHANGKIIMSTTGVGQNGISRDTDAGTAYAVSNEGRLLWETKLPNMPVSPAIYLEDYNLYINTIKTGEVVALDALTGNLVWQAKIGKRIMASSTLINHFYVSMIASISSDGVFVILDAGSGDEIVRYTVGEGNTSSPVADGDDLYLMTAYGISAFGGLGSLVGK